MSRPTSIPSTHIFYGLVDTSSGLPVHLDLGENTPPYAPRLTDDTGYPLYKTSKARVAAMALESNPPYYNATQDFPMHHIFDRRIKDLAPARMTLARIVKRDGEGRVIEFEEKLRAEVVPVHLPKLVNSRSEMRELNRVDAINLGVGEARLFAILPSNEVEEFESLVGKEFRFVGRPYDVFEVVKVSSLDAALSDRPFDIAVLNQIRRMDDDNDLAVGVEGEFVIDDERGFSP